MNPLALRNLSLEELTTLKLLASTFDLPLPIKIPDTFKVLIVKITCSHCKHYDEQYIKLALYDNNVWLRDSTMEYAELLETNLPTEDWNIKIQYCHKCFIIKEPQELAAADHYQKVINEQHSYLKMLWKGKTITKAIVYESIKISAQRIALCYGTPELWRDYLPTALKGEINE